MGGRDLGWGPWAGCSLGAGGVPSPACLSPDAGGLSEEELLQELGHSDLALVHTPQPPPVMSATPPGASCAASPR